MLPIGFSVQKKVTRKLPGDGCSNEPLANILKCWKEELAKSLKRAGIKCKIPALKFTQLDTSNLEYCKNRRDALVVENLIYEAAQSNLLKGVCNGAKPCETTEYFYMGLKQYSKYALSKGELSIQQGKLGQYDFFSDAVYLF